MYVCMYVYVYVETHTKQTYFDHPNKNVEYPNMRIIRI